MGDAPHDACAHCGQYAGFHLPDCPLLDSRAVAEADALMAAFGFRRVKTPVGSRGAAVGGDDGAAGITEARNSLCGSMGVSDGGAP